MTTERQQSGQDGIPQYFLDFVQENARQHAELAESVARSEARQNDNVAGLRESLSDLRASVAEVKGAVNVIRNFTIATFGAMFTLMLIVLTAALLGDLP